MKDGSSTKPGGADLLGFFVTLLPRFYTTYQESLAEQLVQLSIPGLSGPRNLAQIFVPPPLYEWLPETSDSDDGSALQTTGHPADYPISPRKPLDIWEAMRRFPLLAVVGPPGVGKSTLLRHLAWQCASGNASRHQIRHLSFGRHDEPLENLVPIYVLLSDPGLNDDDLLGRIVRTFAVHGFPRARHFLQSKLEQGECLLLFDGLSQVTDQSQREHLVMQIVALARQYGRNQIVVAVRTVGDLDPAPGWRSEAATAIGQLRAGETGWIATPPTRAKAAQSGIVRHCGFTGEAARAFVRRWYRAQGSQAQTNAGSGPLDFLEQSAGLSETARCPLCLTTMLAAREGDLWLGETGLTPVFDWSFQALLAWDDRGAGTEETYIRQPAPYAPEEVTLLEDVALYLHIHRARSVEPALLSEASDQPYPEAILDRVARSHLLQRFNDGSYRFAHQAWQAYFAARALSRSGEIDSANFLKHSGDPWWWDVIAFVSGRQDATDLIRGLREISRWREASSDGAAEALLLAARCITETQLADTNLRDEILEELLAIFPQEKPGLWPRASLAVAAVLGRNVPDAFSEMLKAGPVERRAAAVEAMGRIGGDWAIAPIREALWDEDWRVRQSAAWALGQLEGTRAIHRLVETLSDDQEQVRASAVEALVTLGASAVPSLVASLGDRRPIVREAVIDALGQIGASSAAILVETLEDRRELVREGAKDSLVAIGEPALEALGKALRHEDLETGRMAIATIRLIKSEQAAAVLAKALVDEREPVWHEAMMALGEMGPVAVHPLIIAASEEPGTSERAVTVLEAIGPPALEPLFVALESADRSVRGAAFRALGRMGGHHGQAVIERLQSFVQQDQRDDVRRAAVEALIGIGGDRVVSALVAALGDEEKLIRERASGALRAMGSATVLTQLKSALDQGVNTDVIIELLRTIGTHEAKALLRDLTKSPDAHIAEKAATVLETDTSSGFYFFRLWESRIEENLLTRGRFTTQLLKGIPDASRQVVLQRYIENHPDEDLEYDPEAGVLEIKEFARIRDLMGSDTIQSLEDVETLPGHLFREHATRICHALCDRMGLDKPDGIRYKRWLAFVISAQPIAYGTKLPEALPIVFLHGAEPDATDLADLHHLLPNRLGIYHKTAVLVHFKETSVLERVKQTAHKELHAGYAFDVIVLGAKDVQRVITAKDPARVVRFLICDQADLTVISPYSALGPAEPSMFFGRDLEIRQITHAVGHTSVAVLGGRTIGKTSVLRKVAHVLGEHYRCLQIDCHPLRDYEGLFKTIRERWPEIEDVAPNPLNFYGIALALRNDKPVLFLLDEVDALLEFDVRGGELLFKTFRKLFNEGICRFILSGDRYLNQQLHHGSELGLFNFCGHYVVLGYLEAESARKLITEPMARMNVHLSDETSIVQMILEASCCHPRLVQYICHRLIIRINEERVREIRPEHVKHISESSKFKEDYLTTLWGRATALERIITLLLVLHGSSAVTALEIQAALKTWDIHCALADLTESLGNLELFSLLTRGNGTYSLVPANFAQVVRESQSIELLIDDLRRQL